MPQLLWVARLKRWNAWGPTERDLNKALSLDKRPTSCSSVERMKGEKEWGAGGSFMNSEYPRTQLHHTAICPQQPINWWKGQRVISYLTWQLLMCSEVKHLKWRMGEASEQLQTPDFYRYGFKTSDLMDCAELFLFFRKTAYFYVSGDFKTRHGHPSLGPEHAGHVWKESIHIISVREEKYEESEQCAGLHFNVNNVPFPSRNGFIQ